MVQPSSPMIPHKTKKPGLNKLLNIVALNWAQNEATRQAHSFGYGSSYEAMVSYQQDYKPLLRAANLNHDQPFTLELIADIPGTLFMCNVPTKRQAIFEVIDRSALTVNVNPIWSLSGPPYRYSTLSARHGIYWYVLPPFRFTTIGKLKPKDYFVSEMTISHPMRKFVRKGIYNTSNSEESEDQYNLVIAHEQWAVMPALSNQVPVKPVVSLKKLLSNLRSNIKDL